MALSSGASAQLIIQDDFTQAHDTNSWKTFNGACLTAGDGTGSIPACVGLAYYQGQTLYGGANGTLPDPAGSGALRFTNGNNTGSGFANGYNQAGSIISNFTFPTGEGIQITFKTVTYRGNSGGAGSDGADGMSFFLMDGTLPPYDTGAFGGSLGYTCSNVNNDPTTRADGTVRGFDGLRGGYIGLGIDEYGNFLNGVTNTLGESGTTASGDNTASGGGYQPGRIGLRGAGSISWAGLNALDNLHYPNTLTTAQQQAAVQNTCKTGVIWDYSNPSSARATSTTVPDYAAIAGGFKVLSNVKIASESSLTRTDSKVTPIAYNLRITQDGKLSLSYSTGGNFINVISGQDIVSSNGALPNSFRFGFAGSTGGSTNIHEIMCFQATPANLASTSVAINQKEATKIASGTQAFLAYYFPTDWTGDLTASNLLFDPVSQTISVAATANWDASCNLTGVASGKSCGSTGVAGPTAAQNPTSRAILTWNGSAGIPFEWSSFNNTLQNAIDRGDATPHNANRVNYLRGDRTNEINSAGVGTFRARDSVLGDIVDSSPTWVGPPDAPYASVWKDQLNGSASMAENTGTQSYSQFISAAQTRLNVVYAGANDGLLHGFRAGSFDANNNFVNNSLTPNDGQEVLAYMPGAVLVNTVPVTASSIRGVVNNTVSSPATVRDTTLDYSSAQYGHAFFVDATPDQDDLFYGGKWHTWLVGGLGAGGAAIYALDVTDPTTFSEGGSNPGNIVIGEWNPATISCANVSTCGSSLGSTYGVPVIRRLHNGNWAAIFGNGFGSVNGDAGIFIMTVDATSGARTFYYLSTGNSGPSQNNGISYVSPADLDGDHVVDFVYAGDLQGNIWRFDLTSSNPASWAVGSSPLFTAPSGQPITTKLLLALVPDTMSGPRLMIDFGTGRKFPQTNTTAQTYATGTQSLYGIWDWNMAGSNWNSKSGVTQQLASLTGSHSITTGTLATQTFSSPAAGVRDVTANNVCWSGSSTCPSGNTQFGWQISLPGAGEQVVFNPLLFQSAFIVNTTIPANNSPLSCAAAIDTGFTVAISVSTGGVIPNFFKNYNDTSAAGSQTNGTGTPFVVTAGGNAFLLTQTNGQGCKTCPIPCKPGDKTCSAPTPLNGPTGKRLTWIQRR